MHVIYDNGTGATVYGSQRHLQQFSCLVLMLTGRVSGNGPVACSVSAPQTEAELVECCFTSTETVGLLGTGAQDGHLDFHTAPKYRAKRRKVALLLFLFP